MKDISPCVNSGESSSLSLSQTDDLTVVEAALATTNADGICDQTANQDINFGAIPFHGDEEDLPDDFFLEEDNLDAENVPDIEVDALGCISGFITIANNRNAANAFLPILHHSILIGKSSEIKLANENIAVDFTQDHSNGTEPGDNLTHDSIIELTDDEDVDTNETDEIMVVEMEGDKATKESESFCADLYARMRRTALELLIATDDEEVEEIISIDDPDEIKDSTIGVSGENDEDILLLSKQDQVIEINNEDGVEVVEEEGHSLQTIDMNEDSCFCVVLDTVPEGDSHVAESSVSEPVAEEVLNVNLSELLDKEDSPIRPSCQADIGGDNESVLEEPCTVAQVSQDQADVQEVHDAQAESTNTESACILLVDDSSSPDIIELTAGNKRKWKKKKKLDGVCSDYLRGNCKRSYCTLAHISPTGESQIIPAFSFGIKKKRKKAEVFILGNT